MTFFLNLFFSFSACSVLAQFYADDDIIADKNSANRNNQSSIQILIKLYQHTLFGVRKSSINTTLSILRHCPDIFENNEIIKDLVICLFSAMFGETDHGKTKKLYFFIF